MRHVVLPRSGPWPRRSRGRPPCGPPTRDLTPRPGTPEVDRSTRTVVIRPCLLEVVQHVLRAVGRPGREKTMIVVLEGPAAAHGDEPRIPDLRGASVPAPSRSVAADGQHPRVGRPDPQAARRAAAARGRAGGRRSARRASVVSASRSAWRRGSSTWMMPAQQVGQRGRVFGMICGSRVGPGRAVGAWLGIVGRRDLAHFDLDLDVDPGRRPRLGRAEQRAGSRRTAR